MTDWPCVGTLLAGQRFRYKGITFTALRVPFVHDDTLRTRDARDETGKVHQFSMMTRVELEAEA